MKISLSNKEVLFLSLKYKDDNEVPGIRIGGRCIVSFYKHYIVEIPTENYKDVIIGPEVVAQRITLENLDSCAGGAFSISQMRKYLQDQPDKFIGFVFCHKENKDVIGYLWTALRGADEVQYLIRNIEAYGCDLYTAPKYRGKGYASMMVAYRGRYLEREKGITKVYEALRVNNAATIRAHEKQNVRIVDTRKFIRVLKINVPYQVL